MITIFNQDALKWAESYDGPPFHAMFCDAPYHLTTITKRFGKNGSAPAKFGKDGAFGRVSKGFMGNTWDGGDLAFRAETWNMFGKVLYPGAFGMAFASSRGWHRMAVAIEDAGFVIHPTIFLWNYASGFPKATRVKDDPAFAGHRYGLQALKPAVEPIICFQKPYDGRALDNITQTGAGALNIEAGRVPLNGDSYNINRYDDGAKPFGGGAGHKYSSVEVGRPLRTKTKNKDEEYPSNGIYQNGVNVPGLATGKTTEGRWPSNFILGDEGAAAALDEQTGILTSGEPGVMRKGENTQTYGAESREPGTLMTGFGDSGGASRFFYQVQNQLDNADPVYYCAKASRSERDVGLEDLEMRRVSYMNTHNGDPAEGDEWKPMDDRTGKNRNRFAASVRNPHPTVKPIDLARYLASLLLPPPEYYPRRLFVPFSGVASECIGAHLAGWDEIVGVESDTKNGYIEIANRRIEHWAKPVAVDLFTKKTV